MIIPCSWFVRPQVVFLGRLSFALLGLAVLTQCKDKDPEGPTGPKIYRFTPTTPDLQTTLQTTLIDMKAGETIEFAAGTYNFTNSLTLRDLANVTIRGAGRGQTILDFSGQVAGAEGWRIDNMTNITMRGLTVQDTKGDGIKLKGCDGIKLIDVGAVWTGTPETSNGAYGLYPVSSKNVLMDSCYARGASDAGIYVGQCDRVILRNSKAEENVAGIEIENTLNADVYKNVAVNNTGGILVFDLPNLPQKNGGNIRVFDNQVLNNNHPNYAPAGAIVSEVPSGTGIMIMACRNVDIYNNQITNNNKMGTCLISYDVLAALDARYTYNDSLFNPTLSAIYLHDNTYARQSVQTPGGQQISVILTLHYGTNPPDIIYDGIVPTANEGVADKKVCIRNNANATFVDLNAEESGVTDKSKFKTDLSAYDCTHAALNPVSIP
jgi:parallel beta-helix repeat protein